MHGSTGAASMCIHVYISNAGRICKQSRLSSTLASTLDLPGALSDNLLVIKVLP